MPRDNLTILPVPRSLPLDVSLESFMLEQQAARHSPKTIEHYRYTAGSFVAWLKERGVRDIGHITPDHIRAYSVSLIERGVKDTTQHAHMRGIKSWLKWLVEQGDLEASPMARVRMPKVAKRIPPPFSREDVAKLLAACNRKTELGARSYAICLTLLDTGLRAAEFCSLRVKDVNMRTGMATTLGKGKKERQIRIGAKARSAILRMLALRGEYIPSDPLWAAYDNNGKRVVGPLNVKGLQTLLHRLGKSAGVMPCAPHRFRRTFALWCLRAGMDIESLRVLMGHETLVVLQLYLDIAGEDIERAHTAHSPVDNFL